MREFQALGRSAAYGERGMAATSHPLATLAAVDVLRRGGNAVDAALAASALLAVVEPQMTGLGGDCFVLYAPKGGTPEGPVVALNGSGMAPAAATVEALRARGLTTIGSESPHAVTVPGAVDAWCRLSSDYGTMALADLLAPAIAAAEDGYLVHPRVAADWAGEAERLAASPAAAAAFLSADGRAPEPGDRHRQPKLAASLRAVARSGRDGFYAGEVAEDMVAYLNGLGGLHTLDDFAAQEAIYVTPISSRYRDVDVYECPPNGQGVIALLLANILQGFERWGDPSLPEVDRIHLFTEATKRAYAERDRSIGDPSQVAVPVETLLSPAFAAAERAQIDPLRAAAAPPRGENQHRDTIMLTVVDRDGNAISFINSIFWTFGSTLVSPDSGIVLHNRGMSFRLDPDHPNAIAPRKRPMHTIIPGMMVRDGRAMMPFGVMGGQYQAAGHAHFLTGVVDLGLDPQAAIDRPRYFPAEGLLDLELGVAEPVMAALAGRGHAVRRAVEPMGGGQAILIDHARGVLVGGSDPRKDGFALGW